MRIIKKGKLPLDYTKELTCTRCSTVFEFNIKSESIPSSDPREMGNYRYVNCPLCKENLGFSIP